MMKRNVLLLWILILPFLHGQTSKELLRDGLFAEESEGDLKTATAKYEALLKAFETERKVAAVALYRLAAVKRKQGEEKAALALYQEFGNKFADIEPQATLVRENYLAISGKQFPDSAEGFSEEDKELAKIKKLELSSPDLFPNLDNFKFYVTEGKSKIITYLLSKGADPNHQAALFEAAKAGNLAMTELLLNAGAAKNHARRDEALLVATEGKKWKIAELLASNGASYSGHPDLLSKRNLMDLSEEKITFIVKHGGNPNSIADWNHGMTDFKIPLHDAVHNGKHAFARILLKVGAKVDLAREVNSIRALHIAAALGDEKMMTILIEAGADLNAPTTDDGSNNSRRLKGINLVGPPIAPIDCLPLEKVPFLLKSGAKPTPQVFEKAISAGAIEIVKALIKAGANPNSKLPAGWLPLVVAQSKGNEKLTKALLDAGANFKDSSWYHLNRASRIKYAREFIYPKLAKSGALSVALPEGSQKDKISREVKLDGNVIASLLEMKFPENFWRNDHQYQIDLHRLNWTLFRDGKAAKIDLTRHSLPDFQKGDIMEITGLLKEAFYNGANGSRSAGTSSLANHPSTEIPVALMKATRVPFQITMEGKTWDFMLCPDLWFYDARGNEMPEASLETIVGLIDRDSTNFHYRRRFHKTILVHREGFPELRFKETEETLGKFRIQKGDRIEIFESERQDTSEGKVETIFTEMITAKVSGMPGGWRWRIYNSPSLLALLADLNIGLKEDDFLNNGRLTSSLTEKGYQKILPGIDLSKLIVRRGDEVIEIDLNEKIAAWNEAKRPEKPFDFQLQDGDLIEMIAKEGDDLGFSQSAHEYLQAALNITIMYQKLGEEPKSRRLNYQQVEWHDSPRGEVPVILPETLPSIRGDYLTTGTDYLFIRKGEETTAVGSGHGYWPKQGDFVVEGQARRNVPKRIGPPAPGRVPRTSAEVKATPKEMKKWPLPDGEVLEEEDEKKPSSSRKKRPRYVPNPKK